jgi:hypothetical protein
MMTTWIKAGLALALGAGGGSWLLSSLDSPRSVAAPPLASVPSPDEPPARSTPAVAEPARRPQPAPGQPLSAPVELTSLQRAEAFGDDEVSVGVMDARHVITTWVRDAVRGCMARSAGQSQGAVALGVDIEMADRKVSYVVGDPTVVRGRIDQSDLQCLVREVGGRHRFRSRAALGDRPLTGQETVTVRFTSGRGARAASCPPGG